MSLDLGRTELEVEVGPAGATLPGGEVVSLATLEATAADRSVCRRLDGTRIQHFDEQTGRFYKLVPSGGAPTIEISGVRMHRTKGVTPWPDTESKLAALRPVTGRVLDCTTGLGYTAILAGRTASHVTTIERDPNVLAIARANPWSAELFANRRIEQRIGDAVEVVPTLPSAHFDRVVHDPPTLALAGELYALEFYRELFRVTRPGGRLLVAETSTPTSPRLRRYLEYLMGALPAIARRVSSNPDAYVYFVESLRAWPDQAELAKLIQDAGWTGVAWRDLSGGIVALHRATKPGRA
jgi:predicted methyltransferase